MLEILRFIFSSFWVWLGMLILINAPLFFIAAIIEQLVKLARVKALARAAQKEIES